MTVCPHCQSSAPGGSRYCPACGEAVEAISEAPTRMAAGGITPPRSPGTRPRSGTASGFMMSSLSSSDTLSGARFIPGDILAERYRVVGLLGKGGMGEVYRADDLKVGQAVALKLLPESLEEDEERLVRLMSEVRTARQVSHPNICRVYDVGEAEGTHYLSMEYVDGENLSTLLRRIGRLPGDRAVEIARQICGGLAAAHEQGILHRDLKPANIMIDGKGKVRITDFGLAGVASEIQGAEIRSGTPAYMAPEQLKGEEVSTRSDIYSLGLVFYEMFTGKPPFKADSPAELLQMQQTTTPEEPSSRVSDMDPAVERVVMRCLEADPGQRPKSALAVLGALPGGDPLAAALAAGETPSPEMVADAGADGGLSPAVAGACLLFCLAGLLAATIFVSPLTLMGKIPLERPPEALAFQARDIIEKLGYGDRPADAVYGFRSGTGYITWVQQQSAEERDATDSPARGRWDDLQRVRPSPVSFWYRQSPRQLTAANGVGFVTLNDPAHLVSGMVTVEVDPDGRLTGLLAVPPQQDPEPAGEEPDWAPLFEAAGIDPASFTPAEPEWNPLINCQIGRAWTGSFEAPAPGAPDLPVRVEACAYGGRVASFQLILPWTRPARQASPQAGAGQTALNAMAITLLFGIFGSCVFLVRRNLKKRRGDQRGAFRLAVFIFLAWMVAWLLRVDHVASLTEFGLLAWSLQNSLFLAALAWVLYMALEPYVRKTWPDALISWTRLLAGRFKDPAIGRDILLGGAGGVVIGMTNLATRLAPKWLGQAEPAPIGAPAGPLTGLRHAVSQIPFTIFQTIVTAMAILFLILMLRVLLRRQWIAVGLVLLLMTTFRALFLGTGDIISWVGAGVLWSVLLFLMIRFGVLASIMLFLFVNLPFQYPLTADVSAWYFGRGLVPLIFLAALLIYGFRIATAGQMGRAAAVSRS